MIPISDTDIVLNKRSIRAAIKDVSKSAEAVNLIYVSDNEPGISRVENNGTYSYSMDGRQITSPEVLGRIKSLVIPPAWQNVWICKDENGHLQATGVDKLGRKQYRYHPLWSVIRTHTKFYRLYDFGKRLPDIRKQLDKDLSEPEYSRNKVLAIAVSLLERTSIRVGNSAYEKLYGSFGLTTLKNRHVLVNGNKLHFTFKGKKGVTHNVTIRSKKLARLVQGCKEIPGKELFTYKGDDGEVRKVDSGMLNEYLRNISGGDFTAKDFRTWSGTVQSLIGFKEIGGFETEGEKKRKVAALFDYVAAHLGNTRTVCKKYYVHPLIISLYEEGKLERYLQMLDNPEEEPSYPGLSTEENVLMKILEKLI